MFKVLEHDSLLAEDIYINSAHCCLIEPDKITI